MQEGEGVAERENEAGEKERRGNRPSDYFFLLGGG